MKLTNEQASKIGGITAGLSLVVVIVGAILVEPIVIGVGALGAAAAALVKLKAGPNIFARPTPTNHPMRRAEDSTDEHEHIGA